jgi:hypothetical protein
MSDNLLRLIPTSPVFVPPHASQERAVNILRAFTPRADRVHAEVFPEIQFIDPGENFEGVMCPSCGEDITDSWSEWMDTAAQSQFSKLSIELPCCGLPSDLNMLRYDWPAGFARFMLEAMNPSLDDWLPQANLVVLEETLGCKLRQILAHI